MKVYLFYRGYLGHRDAPYCYKILTETGIADEIYERVFTTAKEVEMADELWAEGSGWADIQCDECGTVYRERCYPGMVVACPVCGNPELISNDAILEASNI
jgi:hypothetical protein